jgi:hypothetical protein
MQDQAFYTARSDPALPLRCHTRVLPGLRPFSRLSSVPSAGRLPTSTTQFSNKMVIEMKSLDISWFWTWSSFATVTVALIIHGALLAAYRVTLHPLAKFPGPRLAAMTLWYEFYYDVILWGQLTNRIKRLHEEYGKPSHFVLPLPGLVMSRRGC